MTDGPDARISVAERERALQELSQHLTAGRLSLTEFDERSARASAATTKEHLAELFSDLPAGVPTTQPLESKAPLPELSLFAAVVSIGAGVLALSTGNWLWLLLIAGTPTVFLISKRMH